MINKRGQITIFIIIAVLIIAMVALFFIFKGKAEKEAVIPGVVNPNAFLKTCMEDLVEETIEILSYQGGYMENPLHINFELAGEPFRKYSYLCYTSSDSSPCVVQQPSIINHMETELEEQVGEELEYCLESLISSLEDEGYEVSEEKGDFEADLIEDELVIKVDTKLTLTKAGQTTIQKDFKIEFPTKLYNLGGVAQTIVGDEAESNYFDMEYYMNLYEEYGIEMYDATIKPAKIYTIEDTKTREKFWFAIRGPY